MKPRSGSVFINIMLILSALITVLGFIFIAVTYIVAVNYYESSTQLLNKDVAAHISEFSEPLKPGGLDKQKADSVFHNAMVLSPNSEVYFLDTIGNVRYFHKSSQEILQWSVSLDKINEYLDADGNEYIKGPDPRDPGTAKIFSAFEVKDDQKRLGYIYVVLSGKDARTIASVVFENNVILFSITLLLSIFFLSLTFSIFYVWKIQKRFNRVVDVLDRFQKGDFRGRFKIYKQDSLGSVKSAFNTMADLMTYHIERLEKSDNERKEFIEAISHDLRNPLSIIGGFAETFLIRWENGTLSNNNQGEFAELILQKVRQVENMVGQLYDLASMDSIGFKPKRELFMFSELLQQVAHSFRVKADDKKIPIICQGCESHKYINADIRMMERVIQNLIANAISYSPEKSTIRLSLNEESEFLVCSFENVSEPLNEDMLSWLRHNGELDKVLAPEIKALGLSIVKRILAIHKFPLAIVCANGSVSFEFRMQLYSPDSVN